MSEDDYESEADANTKERFPQGIDCALPVEAALILGKITGKPSSEDLDGQPEDRSADQSCFKPDHSERIRDAFKPVLPRSDDPCGKEDNVLREITELHVQYARADRLKQSNGEGKGCY